MVQLHCLTFWNIGVTYRVLDQHILHSPAAGCTLLTEFSCFFRSLFRPHQQTVEEIKEDTDYEQSKRSQFPCLRLLSCQVVLLI